MEFNDEATHLEKQILKNKKRSLQEKYRRLTHTIEQQKELSVQYSENLKKETSDQPKDDFFEMQQMPHSGAHENKQEVSFIHRLKTVYIFVLLYFYVWYAYLFPDKDKKQFYTKKVNNLLRNKYDNL